MEQDNGRPGGPSQAEPKVSALRASVPDAKKRWRWPNYVHIGPVTIRTGSRYLAKWGFPRVQIGGLSLWSWTNSGDLQIAAYHPRASITWLWYVNVTKRNRGYAALFSKEERDRRARLFVTGNPYVGPTRWFHRFWQPDYRRINQWHDYLRLPFGFALMIGHQEPMWRKSPVPQECAPTHSENNQ